jgi:large subunit ribosomal protein L16
MNILSPKFTKHSKMHRGRLSGKTLKNSVLIYGDFGIQALEPAWLTARQIEAVRRTILRYIKKTGKLWIKVFPDKSITARAVESRMGTGKGSIKYWVAVIKPGYILFELSGITEEIAKLAFKVVTYKLPIHTRLIRK